MFSIKRLLEYPSLCYVIFFGVLFYLIIPVSLEEEHQAHSNHTLFKHILISSTRRPLLTNPELSIVSAGIMEKIVLDILSNHMRFTYEIIPPSDILSSGFLQRNGSWTGTTGQLQRREVDMCVTWGAPSIAKASVMDVSYPVVYVDSSIMIPFPRQKSKIWVQETTFEGLPVDPVK
ncbi:glutamate receptor ionotropic, kainate glr-3-like [Daphnia pulex]|uniref:glutamate receptor ionotropic, kainate glr-3-like n=1 Tax=Daphnia pulex TaxID=6669 RepID=UPI001EDE7EBF|nr:glutamate receptor ionotropic, kainate glr-3-like [Daphnia pulex]